MSSDQKKADLLFDKWKADLKEKDRSRAAVEGNFEELFLTLYRNDISFDTAYTILDKAINAHYPPDKAVDFTYKRLKSVVSKSKQEFLEEWKGNIEAAAKRVFYSLYSVDEGNEEEAQYGHMSPIEYRKQRKYADNYPVVDWTNIKIEPISVDSLDIDLSNLEEDDGEAN